jgi:hypothetical protein
MSDNEWAKEQLKPLSMFETAKWWADGLKIVGAGNGAGFLTAGAALNSFQGHHRGLIEVKIAGSFFFVGIISFAFAILMVYIAMHAQDEVSHAAIAKDTVRRKRNSAVSGGSMLSANKLAILTIVSFFLGCLVGVIAFWSY